MTRDRKVSTWRTWTPRNREWTEPDYVIEAREDEKKKQLMKEAIKEALEESGIPLEDLMKILNKQ